MSLRETIQIELAGFNTAHANFEGPNKRVMGMINSLFQSLYNNDYDHRLFYLRRGEPAFNKFVEAFKLDVPENVSRIDTWCGRLPTDHVDRIEVVDDDFVVFLKINGVVKNEGVEKPVYEWVMDGPDTKRRKQVKKKGLPATKKTQDEYVTEKVILGFHFPLSLLEDILTEIGQDSFLVPPTKESYIPRPLGLNLGAFFSDVKIPFPMPSMGGRGDYGMMPSMRYFQSGRDHSTNYRLFLKPEPGSDRLEVEFEPCPEEDVRERAELIKQRTEWFEMNLLSTKALTEFSKTVIKKD